jgi:hypothetical protein
MRRSLHARVTSRRGSPAEIDRGIKDFRENRVSYTREHARVGILLVDRETGRSLEITLWEDEHALGASEERAHRARQTARRNGAAPLTVDRYEVAVFDFSSQAAP